MRKLAVMMVLVLLLLTTAFSVKISLWTAPNPFQEQFWKTMLDEWKLIHPEIEVEWKTIPASGSSEEAVLTAIVTGQAPDLCTNIFSGFAAQLIEAEQLVPLNGFKEFEEVVETRKMTQAIEGWKSGDDYYVMPIYSNPMLFWWRKDILEKAGFEGVPRTYSDVYRLAEKVCVPKEVYSIQFFKGKNWWDRWFDFITFYYAASDGKPYIDAQKGKALFNDEYGKELSEFVWKLFENGWTAVDMLDNPLFTGNLAGTLMGPWSIPWAKSTFPDVYPDKIIMGPPPVPDNYPADKPVKTFADTKGMVMFNSSKNKEAAWEFMKWVFSNPEHDKLWLELTNLPPVRADLTTNPEFEEIMLNNPEMAEYAQFVPLAVPPALTSKTIEVQDAMTVNLTEPLYLLRGSVEEILKNAVKAINRELF